MEGNDVGKSGGTEVVMDKDECMLLWRLMMYVAWAVG